LQGDAQGYRSAVVEDIDGEFADFDGVEEGDGCGCEIGEGIAVVWLSGDNGEAITGEVGG
jgi:hypothetical protein